MRSRAVAVAAVVTSLSLLARDASAAPGKGAGEYAKHFAALAKLSIAVAETMPREQYAFRPHPDSMTFGDLMVHIATTNYQFCAGLKDTDAPPLSSPTDRAGVVKLLSDSFAYCAPIIAAASDELMDRPHGSPDGRLSGRELLLALYIHVAHHRGQAEIYLRDKGIKPPAYVI